MSARRGMQVACDRCGTTCFKEFLEDVLLNKVGWGIYPGGLTLCPHCKILFENGYSEKHIIIEDEREDW